MTKEHNPVAFNESTFIINSKDTDILELIESVFTSRSPNYYISSSKKRINNAIADTIIKL